MDPTGSTYEFQQSLNSLNDFLVIKSAGRALKDLSPVVVPVREISDYVYPNVPISVNHSATTTTNFSCPFNPGVFRIRGIAILDGINGLTAGLLSIDLVFNGVETIFLQQVYSLASTVFNSSISFDLLFITSTTIASGQNQIAVVTTATAGVTSVRARVSATVFKVG